MTENSENVSSNHSELPAETRQPRRSIRWVLERLPNVVVLCALAGLAYWGHHSGWKLPRYSELRGEVAQVDDWCPAHNVPESECIECIPTLHASQHDHGWCKVHGVHQCPLCHPDVAQVKSTPTIDSELLQEVSLALDLRDRQQNNLGCTLYRARVQFTSIESVRKSGIDVELVDTRPIEEAISANGEITYDETRVAHLASRVPGTIWRVFKVVGDRVEAGDVLAVIDAVDVGKAKAELLDALALVEFHTQTVNRLKPLYEKQVITGSRMLEAETGLQQATIQVRRAEQELSNLGLRVSVDQLKRMADADRVEHLRLLGIPESIRAELAGTTSNNLIPLQATLDGVVVHREAVTGEVVNPTQLLFRLVDTSRMWLRFNVAMEDANHLTVGQHVRFAPDGTRRKVTGQISWISTDVDPKTRTVEVRSEVDNSEGKLRNETFGLGHIILRRTQNAVVVPEEAVQWDGSCFVTFVRDKDYFVEDQPKIFHTRSVRPGVTQDGFTEIIAGLLPGEVVATKGSGVLRSQILKNNLGPGCTCGH